MLTFAGLLLLVAGLCGIALLAVARLSVLIFGRLILLIARLVVLAACRLTFLTVLGLVLLVVIQNPLQRIAVVLAIGWGARLTLVFGGLSLALRLSFVTGPLSLVFVWLATGTRRFAIWLLLRAVRLILAAVGLVVLAAALSVILTLILVGSIALLAAFGSLRFAGSAAGLLLAVVF